MKKHLTEAERLDLICEAIRYSISVKSKRMPSSCYSKALREPIWFLWDSYEKSKEWVAEQRSEEAKGLKFGSGEIALDHAMPFKCIQDELLGLGDPSPEAVKKILKKYGKYMLVTRKQHGRLSAKDKEFENFEEMRRLYKENEWFRYDALEIKHVPNERPQKPKIVSKSAP